MAERFFLDSELPHPPRRGGVLTTLAGLVVAVALFVSTLSLIASQYDARRAPAAEPPAPQTTALPARRSLSGAS